MSDTKTPVTTTIARDIRRRREAQGLSQQDLADEVGVKRARIKRLEAAEVDSVDLKLLERIARALGGAGKGGGGGARGSSSRTPARAPKPSPKKSSRRKRLAPSPAGARQAVRKVLEKSGLLDMTLRELLG